MSDTANTSNELARLKTEVERLSSEIQRIENKLNSGGFLLKAPAALVEKEQNKMRSYQSDHAKMQAQVDAMQHQA